MSVNVSAPTIPQAEEAKANNFNFLRLALATAVIFSHSAPLLLGTSHLDPMASALHYQIDQRGDYAMNSGHLAVYGFFVISGYLISMSFARSRSIGQYLKKRALRIYPGFLTAVLLCAVLFGPLGSSNGKTYWLDLLCHSREVTLNALNLSVDFNKPPFLNSLTTAPLPHIIDGSVWTIRYEFLCYLMVALLGVIALPLFRRFPAARFIAPTAFFLTFYGLYTANLNRHLLGWPNVLNHSAPTAWLIGDSANIPRLFTYFVAGMCFYTYRRWVSYSTPLMLAALLILVVSARCPPLLPLTLPIFGPYVLLAIAFAPWLKLSHIGTKHDLSYGIYLYGFPVQQLLVFYFGRWLTPGTEFLVALPVTMLFAWLSWTMVEHPALKFKDIRRSASTAQLTRRSGNALVFKPQVKEV